MRGAWFARSAAAAMRPAAAAGAPVSTQQLRSWWGTGPACRGIAEPCRLKGLSATAQQPMCTNQRPSATAVQAGVPLQGLQNRALQLRAQARWSLHHPLHSHCTPTPTPHAGASRRGPQRGERRGASPAPRPGWRRPRPPRPRAARRARATSSRGAAPAAAAAAPPPPGRPTCAPPARTAGQRVPGAALHGVKRRQRRRRQAARAPPAYRRHVMLMCGFARGGLDAGRQRRSSL